MTHRVGSRASPVTVGRCARWGETSVRGRPPTTLACTSTLPPRRLGAVPPADARQPLGGAGEGGAYWMKIRTDTRRLRVGDFFGGCVHRPTTPVWVFTDSTKPIAAKRWTHVAATCDGARLRTSSTAVRTRRSQHPAPPAPMTTRSRSGRSTPDGGDGGVPRRGARRRPDRRRALSARDPGAR